LPLYSTTTHDKRTSSRNCSGCDELFTRANKLQSTKVLFMDLVDLGLVLFPQLFNEPRSSKQTSSFVLVKYKQGISLLFIFQMYYRAAARMLTYNFFSSTCLNDRNFGPSMHKVNVIKAISSPSAPPNPYYVTYHSTDSDSERTRPLNLLLQYLVNCCKRCK
jgi:hypothetical protein